MSSLRQITNETFESEVLQYSEPVLVHFMTDWCGLCKAMLPILERTAEAYKNKIKLVTFNVDTGPNMITRYDLSGIPTILIFHSGELNDRIEGIVTADQLQTKLKEFLTYNVF
ncbi:MAG: thioredoxin [bacterium]|nr:thioredoxin [bacterium]